MPTDEAGTAALLDVTLEPVSGLAIPVLTGQVLRISQTQGGQCVDFNCFNLHDWHEHMSVATMRRDGFRVAPGRLVMSGAPFGRPLMRVVSMSPTCQTDLLAPRCTSRLFERAFGLGEQPNCHSTLAETIRSYGLDETCVHDSLNLWMDTGFDDIGWSTLANTGQPGDQVDLVALRDVLAVPVVCGSGNVFPTSNFSYKPIRLQVFNRTAAQ
ncbi:MAG: DUF1989 domain-containing protein [Candidatus Limnocylindrales bacterium]